MDIFILPVAQLLAAFGQLPAASSCVQSICASPFCVPSHLCKSTWALHCRSPFVLLPTPQQQWAGGVTSHSSWRSQGKSTEVADASVASVSVPTCRGKESWPRATEPSYACCGPGRWAFLSLLWARVQGRQLSSAAQLTLLCSEVRDVKHGVAIWVLLDFKPMACYKVMSSQTLPANFISSGPEHF